MVRSGESVGDVEVVCGEKPHDHPESDVKVLKSSGVVPSVSYDLSGHQPSRNDGKRKVDTGGSVVVCVVDE